MSTKTSAATRLADRYIRADDFAARIDGIELAPEIWAVFAQLAQPRNAPELARLLTLDIEAVNAALRRLVRRKLIRKHVLAWRDYAATSPAATLAPSPSPATNAPAPRPPSDSVPPFYVHPKPAPATPRSPILSLRIASTAPARTAPAISFRLANPAGAPPPATAGMKLRPILDAIGAKAGGGVAGQLLVYRVFLQIPTELMQAAGLHSLSLVDDHYTLRHPELRAALAATARQHAGIDIETIATA